MSKHACQKAASPDQHHLTPPASPVLGVGDGKQAGHACGRDLRPKVRRQCRKLNREVASLLEFGAATVAVRVATRTLSSGRAGGTGSAVGRGQSLAGCASFHVNQGLYQHSCHAPRRPECECKALARWYRRHSPAFCFGGLYLPAAQPCMSLDGPERI